MFQPRRGTSGSIAFIQHRERFSHLAPTVREIGAAVGLRSSSTVQTHIDQLINLGVITRGREARSIRLTTPGTLPCPHCHGSGRIVREAVA